MYVADWGEKFTAFPSGSRMQILQFYADCLSDYCVRQPYFGASCRYKALQVILLLLRISRGIEKRNLGKISLLLCSSGNKLCSDSEKPKIFQLCTISAQSCLIFRFLCSGIYLSNLVSGSLPSTKLLMKQQPVKISKLLEYVLTKRCVDLSGVMQ